ncbi:MAG: hypothetical protein WBG46_05140 [Nonlabens sp.]
MRPLLLLSFLLLSLISAAQVPQSMAYQAVVRDASGTILSDQQVGIKVNIYANAVTGSSVYVETHTVTTNATGLLDIQIGNGTAMTGTFSSIDWSTGNYWLETKIDPLGGTNYSITGSSQLLSVPFAFHSNTTSSVTSGSTSGGNNGNEWLIPYMPYNANISQIIHVTSYYSDSSATSGSTDLNVQAIDDNGNSYNLGSISTLTDERVTNLSPLLMDQLTASGFQGSGKISFKISPSNDDFNLYFYAAFNVGGSDRTQVNVINLD